MGIPPNSIEHLKAAAAAFGNEPLLVCSDGNIINLAKGYIQLHVNFTVEDKAAKGLRKCKVGDVIIPPDYFSALESVLDNRCLLLVGPSGSGKTTFAKHMAFTLATRAVNARLDTTPYYYFLESQQDFHDLLNVELPKLMKLLQATKSDLLIIIDSIDKLGKEAYVLLDELLTLCKHEDRIRLLLLGDSFVVKQWFLPSDIVRQELRPLSETQRRDAVSSLTEFQPSYVVAGTGTAADLPILFSLALEANSLGENTEELLDAWLEVVAPEQDTSRELEIRAYGLHSKTSLERLSSATRKHPQHFFSKAVQNLLAARHLMDLPRQAAIDLFHLDMVESEPIIRSLLARLDIKKRQLLLQGLLSGSKSQEQFGALLVSDFISKSSGLPEHVSNQMKTIIHEAVLPIMYREKAGRVLSRLGDSRDMTCLATIPAGNFTMGDENHPNSQPVTIVSLESFRIGIFPVINRDYSRFVKETGREWQTPDGFDPETFNAPATDLTWYDARAYCAWLTPRWQEAGIIGRQQHVRLPTEPEWERAARGDQQSSADRQTIYPWGTEWNHDAANYEETGFNKRVSVGLFPAGCSPYGCHDMAGQVWEWCSTLWGEDMTTPSFQYPWRNDDGREDLNVPGSIRRVLRGGCFSSGRSKASCTYRGSLEPGGFWRGNGFRVVVAPLPR